MHITLTKTINLPGASNPAGATTLHHMNFEDLLSNVYAIRSALDDLSGMTEKEYKTLKDEFDLILFEAYPMMVRTERAASEKEFYKNNPFDEEWDKQNRQP